MVRHPEATVSVTRPTLVLQPDAASEIGRYFLGPLLFPAVRAVPGAVAKLLPLPLPGSLHLAFVHSDDVASALRSIERFAVQVRQDAKLPAPEPFVAHH